MAPLEFRVIVQRSRYLTKGTESSGASITKMTASILSVPFVYLADASHYHYCLHTSRSTKCLKSPRSNYMRA